LTRGRRSEPSLRVDGMAMFRALLRVDGMVTFRALLRVDVLGSL